MKKMMMGTLIAALTAGLAMADKPEHAGKGKKAKYEHYENAQYRAEKRYEREEKRSEEYYERSKKRYEKAKERKKKHYEKAKKRFDREDDNRIHHYYGNLPRGLQKKLRREGQLPPGWQKYVQVGKPMPLEYLQYAQPVPQELSSQISVGPIGTKLLQLSDRVIRIEAGTNMVLDAIRF